MRDTDQRAGGTLKKTAAKAALMGGYAGLYKPPTQKNLCSTIKEDKYG